MRSLPIRYRAWAGLLAAAGALTAALGAPAGRQGPGAEPSFFRTDVPAHPLDVILCRPTRDSVTLSLLAYEEAQVQVAYGTTPDAFTSETPLRRLSKGQPAEVVIGGLQPDTRCYYQVRLSRGGTPTAGSAGSFHTARGPGAPFTVTVTADSHLDERTDPALYQRTLLNCAADAPDFHIDLGDTFMTEKHASRESAARQYLAQRHYFGILGAPLFLVLGNHDGETARERDGAADSLAAWSAAMRKRYFPNPEPDGFYTGGGSRLQDYYAWEWGDALFVVLDPFWFSPRQRGGDDNWVRTLGAEQYQWLRRTLEGSKAPLKFLFIHHLVGGAGRDARGGVEAAGLYEWGGRNPDGSDGFAAHRPGWPAPIHELLVKSRVAAVFHGHDHLFARQELDGVVYQDVPQPGFAGRWNPDRAAEAGYVKGTILGGSGHLRVTVAADGAKVEYVRACLPAQESAAEGNRSVVHAYTLAPAAAGH